MTDNPQTPDLTIAPRAFVKTRKSSPQQCFGIIERSDMFTFSFVRDPLRRAASAFADKVMSAGRHRRKLMKKLGRLKTDEISFAEFIGALSERADILDLDRHWRPQHKELAVGAIRYDHLGAMDHLGRDLPEILEYIFGVGSRTIEDTRKTFGHRTASADLIHTLSARERSKFEQVMAKDYTLYEQVRGTRFAA